MRTASPEDVLDQLALAMGAADHLGDLSDHLVGQFVDQARRSGASWTDIGRSTGVSKQAARQRFIPKDPGPPEALDASQGFDQTRRSGRRRRGSDSRTNGKVSCRKPSWTATSDSCGSNGTERLLIIMRVNRLALASALALLGLSGCGDGTSLDVAATQATTEGPWRPSGSRGPLRLRGV